MTVVIAGSTAEAQQVANVEARAATGGVVVTWQFANPVKEGVLRA